jgi:hypothetical protein
MLYRAAVVKSGVSKERSVGQLLVTVIVVPCSLILVALMIEALIYFETSMLQEPHGVTYQRKTFFIVIAVNTSNLTKLNESKMVHF